MSGQMILAIETALGGGSVALLGGDEILYQHSGSVSRAAELILAVDEALESARSPVTDLQMIAVSTGPGSFTGIRVGIATALGLARSREIAVSGISLFDAIASADPMDNAVVAIQLGRGRFGVQSFSCDGSTAKAESDPTSMTESELSKKILETPSLKFFIYGDEALFAASDTMSRIPPNVRFIDENLAVLIAKRAIDMETPGKLLPIYLGR